MNRLKPLLGVTVYNSHLFLDISPKIWPHISKYNDYGYMLSYITPFLRASNPAGHSFFIPRGNVERWYTWSPLFCSPYLAPSGKYHRTARDEVNRRTPTWDTCISFEMYWYKGPFRIPALSTMNPWFVQKLHWEDRVRCVYFEGLRDRAYTSWSSRICVEVCDLRSVLSHGPTVSSL